MKKYLLPLAALLLGSASLSAEEVTVKYYGNVYKTNTLSDVELFQPTTHEVVDNGDGTYTFKRFLNAKDNQGSYKDIVFSFDENGTISYKGFEEGTAIENLGGTITQYFVDLTSAVDGTTKLNFPGYIFSTFSFFCPAKVEKLGDDSEYTYHVIIGSGISGAPNNYVKDVPGASQFTNYTGNAGFCLVFDMGKKEKQPSGDDGKGAVTVSYYCDGESDYKINKEIFETTQSEVAVNEDGSYTLKNWQNSGADLTFQITSSKVNGPKFETYGMSQVKFISPALSTTSYSMATIGDYEASLKTKAGAEIMVTDYSNGYKTTYVTVQQPEAFTCPLKVTPGYCGAEIVEDTPEATVYRVVFRTEWKNVPNPDYNKDGGINPTYATIPLFSGWTSFNLTVEKEPEPEPEPLPEGQYKVTYTTYGTYNYVSDAAYEIEVKDANNIVFKNFLGSGYDIPMVFDEPTAVEGQDYYASGTLMPTSEYCPKGNRIVLPGGETFVANIPTISAQSDPLFYWSGNFGWVRYYKEGNKVKKSIHITFGSTGYYCADWDMYEGGDDESGIEDVEVDENAPAEWYNLQGVRVSGENLAPGIYIKRQGSKTVKVLVK